MEGRYIPGEKFNALEARHLGQNQHFKEQTTLASYLSGKEKRDTLLISSPFGKTLPIDTLHTDQLSGQRCFEIEPVAGTDSVVLLTSKPDKRVYVASKSLSLYNVTPKKYTLLGTNAKTTTKAYDVSGRKSLVYTLLYDDRRNRPLLQRVSLELEKAFQM